MQNIKMILAYDGTNYHGFQIQNKTTLKTIQGSIEKALSTLTGNQVTIYGSGRTDSGVHARGQVINFLTDSRIPVEKYPLAVNSLLPPDIRVWKAEEVTEDFHARFNARKKTYHYTIYNDRHMSPFWRHYAYHVPVDLEIGKMKEAADQFQGIHDFSSFCAKNTAVSSFIRTIYSCLVIKEGSLITIKVEGNGFLYNMVRIMTGTLLEVGWGKRSVSEIPYLLEAKDRKQAGVTVPPHGLCLWSVNYE